MVSSLAFDFPKYSVYQIQLLMGKNLWILLERRDKNMTLIEWAPQRGKLKDLMNMVLMVIALVQMMILYQTYIRNMSYNNESSHLAYVYIYFP